ncbi:MAG: hypothetical protein ABID45_04380 [Patescibacteria group bacterium]
MKKIIKTILSVLLLNVIFVFLIFYLVEKLDLYTTGSFSGFGSAFSLVFGLFIGNFVILFVSFIFKLIKGIKQRKLNAVTDVSFKKAKYYFHSSYIMLIFFIFYSLLNDSAIIANKFLFLLIFLPSVVLFILAMINYKKSLQRNNRVLNIILFYLSIYLYFWFIIYFVSFMNINVIENTFIGAIRDDQIPIIVLILVAIIFIFFIAYRKIKLAKSKKV